MTETPTPPSRAFEGLWQRAAVAFAAAALLIALCGGGLFWYARNQVLDQQWRLLDALAEERLREIAGWRHERSRDLRWLTQTPDHHKELGAFLRQEAPLSARLATDLTTLIRTPPYDAAFIADAQGNLRYHSGRPLVAAHRLERLLPQTIASEGPSFFDGMAPGAPGRELRILALHPVSHQGRVIGAVGLQIDPDAAGAPLVTAFPVTDSSVEVLMFRPDGPRIVYLTGPRYAQEREFSITPPPGLLAAQVLRGARRVVGVDYRNAPAMGVGAQVPGTPWHLVAKVDRREVSGPIRALAVGSALLMLLLLSSAAYSARRWLREEQARSRAAASETELSRLRLERRVELLSRYANDAILFADLDGAIREVNERAEELYGYPRHQLLAMNLRQLRAPAEIASFDNQYALASTGGRALFETVQRRQEGSEFPAEVSLRLIGTPGEEGYLAVVRDITERKRAEQRSRRLNDLLTVLGRGNAAIIHERDPARLMQSACHIAVAEDRFDLAWIGSVDHGRCLLTLAASAGGTPPPALFAEALRPPTRSLSARALAENGPVQDQNLNGFAAAIPIRGQRGTRGVLGVALRERLAFDAEMIGILNQLACDLGYALENIEAEQARAAAEQALHASEERMSRVLESAGEGIYGVNLDGMVTFINQSGAGMLGYSPAALIGKHLHALIHSRHADGTPYPASECRLYAAGRYGITLSGDDEFFWRGDGSGFYVAYTATPLHAQDGTIQGSVVVFQDITRRKRTEEQLRLAAQVFESSHEAILILDQRTLIVSANRAFTLVTGYRPEEVIGRSPTLLNSGAQDEAFYADLWDTVAREGHWAGTLRDRRKSGESYPLWLSVSAVRDGAGQLTHYVAIATDMSEREEAQQRIRVLAYHDPLTGLANRSLLLDRMAQQLVHARRNRERGALLIVDVDHFKNVNDSLGHLIGDALLEELARRITACVRKEDTVARQGGDEFMVAISELRTPEDASDVALKVLAEVSRPIRLDGAEVRTTATIGIALCPEDGDEPELLIRNANAALHHAKARARGSFSFFVPELNQRARERLAMETDLRRAVERGDFELHYQPQISARTGAMVRVEALLRWRCGEALINPARFVPLAEETGLVVPIGEWVADEVCRQQRAWVQQGLPQISIAFNLSGGQFKDPSAMKRLRAILAERCADPRALELELTEGVVMQEAEASMRALTDLKEIGICLAIDDFGTGYSSLSYLRRFPIDRLKVDQSFVRRLPGQAADRAVVDAIIMLARGLGLGVIAEGVETDSEAGFLRARDCDELQGYYFCAPLPPAELANWWRANAEAARLVSSHPSPTGC